MLVVSGKALSKPKERMLTDNIKCNPLGIIQINVVKAIVNAHFTCLKTRKQTNILANNQPENNSEKGPKHVCSLEALHAAQPTITSSAKVSKVIWTTTVLAWFHQEMRKNKEEKQLERTVLKL